MRKYRYQNSYRMKARRQRSYKVKKKRGRSVLRSRIFWQAMLLFLCVMGLLYFLFLSPVFQIKNVNVSGNNDVSSSQILSKVDGKISNHFMLFPTKSIFLANASNMRSDLMDSFPQIAGVSFSRHFPSTIDVKVTERQGVAVWCGNNCFLVDGTGVIFKQVSPIFSQPMGLKVSGSDPGAKAGDKIIDPKILASVLEITSKMNAAKLDVKSADVVSDNRVNVTTGEGWQAYFNLQGDIDWQITELNVVLQKEISPQERAALQYIDLRFTRVYYK